MDNQDDLQTRLAKGHAEDYQRLCKEERCQGSSTFRHVVIGLSLALLFVAVVTIGILVGNN